MFHKAERGRFSLVALARRDATALVALVLAAGWLLAAMLIALLL